MTEIPLESPPADVVEQRAEVVGDPAGPVRGDVEPPLEADPADVRDQAEEVPLDDEEWQ